MSDFLQAAEYLPFELKNVLLALPDHFMKRIQEIRLRLDAPLMLSTPDGEWMVKPSGHPTQAECENLVVCNGSVMEESFLKLCEYSVHTHQNELRAGFITAQNGCRAGIAGTAVVDNGGIVSYRNITSICLRVARSHDGCASELVSALFDRNNLQSALICGEPSSGKSSLLRDLAKNLSTGAHGRRWRTAVVDERGELSGGGRLGLCDVLRYCPKAAGIQQAIRCLAPDVVIFDELGTTDETKAVIEGLNSGVTAIASAHCRNIETLLRRPPLKAALESGAFEQVVFLKGRSVPGSLSRIVKAGEIIA